MKVFFWVIENIERKCVCYLYLGFNDCVFELIVINFVIFWDVFLWKFL